MQHRTIKQAELTQMIAGGAGVKRPPREVIVDGLTELVEKLKCDDDSRLAEVVGQLIEVIREKETEVEVNIDLKPLIAMLAPKAYHFEIVRNNRRELTDVIAKPLAD